jgi:hypothetical protein
MCTFRLDLCLTVTWFMFAFWGSCVTFLPFSSEGKRFVMNQRK